MSGVFQICGVLTFDSMLLTHRLVGQLEEHVAEAVDREKKNTAKVDVIEVADPGSQDARDWPGNVGKDMGKKAGTTSSQRQLHSHEIVDPCQRVLNRIYRRKKSELAIMTVKTRIL